jgi:hypothetical protein
VEKFIGLARRRRAAEQSALGAAGGDLRSVALAKGEWML